MKLAELRSPPPESTVFQSFEKVADAIGPARAARPAARQTKRAGQSRLPLQAPGLGRYEAKSSRNSPVYCWLIMMKLIAPAVLKGVAGLKPSLIEPAVPVSTPTAVPALAPLRLTMTTDFESTKPPKPAIV